MTELTNLDICKRIAEIEGLTCELRESLFGNKILYALTESHGGLKSYNPLKDDALCFQLIIKHKIDLIFNEFGTVSAYYSKKYALTDTNSNKAALLAIIEAHND